MIWTVTPAEALGPLRLGMSPEDVAALPALGKPGHVYRGMGGRAMEYRGPRVPICEYRDGALTRIVAGRKVPEVVFEGVNLFAAASAAAVRFLESRLGPVTLCEEQLHFRASGLCLGGFYDAHDHRFFEPGVEYHDERSIALSVPASAEETVADEPVSFL